MIKKVLNKPNQEDTKNILHSMEALCNTDEDSDNDGNIANKKFSNAKLAKEISNWEDVNRWLRLVIMLLFNGPSKKANII